MNVDDAPAPKPVFNNAAVTEILEETGLSLAKGMTTGEFQEALEEVACEHYWNEFTQPAPVSQNSYISFDALAGPSVTPSRLKSRLVGIERSAKRVFKGTSRRPFVEKVEELLNRLGRHRNGRPLKFSGTETPGHGGSERSAVWLWKRKKHRGLRVFVTYPRNLRQRGPAAALPAQATRPTLGIAEA